MARVRLSSIAASDYNDIIAGLEKYAGHNTADRYDRLLEAALG